MRALWTLKDVTKVVPLAYTTIRRMIITGRFPGSVNGRNRKLLFDPDAIEAWIKNQQSTPSNTPQNITSSKQLKREKKSFEERQKIAQKSLDRHRKS